MNFYIVPKIGTGSPTDTYRPKYVGDLAGVAWSAMDYGLDDTFLVGAQTDATQHATLTGYGDVLAVPPLDEVVGGNPTLNRVKNSLEQRSIPAHWLTAGTSWRVALGTVGRFCLILQRLHGRHGRRLFEPGMTLDTTLSAPVLTELQDVGASFALQTSALSTSTVVRDALTLLGDQLPPFRLAGETF